MSQQRRAGSGPMRPGRARRGVPWAAAALAVGLLAGCGGSPSGTPSANGTQVADAGYQSGDGTTTTWAVGHRTGPVEVRGTDFDGQPQDVSAWRGDVVVINTWYAACPPCRAEIGDLVALAKDEASAGVHVLGINPVDDTGTAKAFARAFSVPYPSIQDTDGAAIAALQGVVPVNATPTTVVLDREGRIYARILGAVDPSTLKALVKDVLAEPATATPTTTGAAG
jgi:peroxiredoxin